MKQSNQVRLWEFGYWTQWENLRKENQINHWGEIIDKYSLCFLLWDISLLLLFNLMTMHRADLLWFVLSFSLSLATIILIKDTLSSYPTVLSIAWSNQERNSARKHTKQKKSILFCSSVTKAPYCYLNIFSDVCAAFGKQQWKRSLIFFLYTYKYCC